MCGRPVSVQKPKRIYTDLTPAQWWCYLHVICRWGTHSHSDTIHTNPLDTHAPPSWAIPVQLPPTNPRTTFPFWSHLRLLSRRSLHTLDNQADTNLIPLSCVCVWCYPYINSGRRKINCSFPWHGADTRCHRLVVASEIRHSLKSFRRTSCGSFQNVGRASPSEKQPTSCSPE